MPSPCSQLKQEYEQLKALKAAFALEYAKVRESGDLTHAKKLMRDLKAARDALRDKLFVSLERAIKLLGRENVHGVEDVEAMLGQGFIDRSKVPPIPYTATDLKKSKEIKEQTGVEETLVLFVGEKDGTPLTGERMIELIQLKYTQNHLGTFLYHTGWYKNENFFKQLGLTYEWKLITKQTIPNSKKKRHHFKAGDKWKHEDTQEYAIEEYAKLTHIPRTQLHRPEPFHMLYAIALHLITTERLKGQGKGERLLSQEWHWSDVTSSDGNFVYVGDADAGGAGVFRNSRDSSGDDLGVCLSRDPF